MRLIVWDIQIQIVHQPEATIFQFIILAFIYSSICFGRSPVQHQELNDCSSNLWFYLRIVVIAVLCSWSGRRQHGYHHDTKLKSEAATAVIELLIMGGRTPETYWAVNKRQENKLKNCYIWLVIYLNCTVMHGLTNLKCLRYIWLLTSCDGNFIGHPSIRVILWSCVLKEKTQCPFAIKNIFHKTNSLWFLHFALCQDKNLRKRPCA
jgi:hypothetical protein